MIIKYPTYYKDFKCIANKCPDTCCVGWQVVVDKSTAEFYNNLKGTFGEKIRRKMIVDQDGDTVFVNCNGRCPFLNKSNLCDIHINVGEKYLCHTCTMFPRFYETFGGTREMGLSLSCPVANDLILNDKELVFKQEFSEEEPEFNDIDADLYMCLKNEREKLISFVKSGIEMNKKLSGILSYAEKLKQLLEYEDYEGISKLEIINNSTKELLLDERIFDKLEYLTIDGKTLLTGKKQGNHIYSEKYTNILVYFIYRYFLKSIYKSNTYQYLKFAVFSTQVIGSLEHEKFTLSEVSRIYSKEIEHSADNLNSILEYLSK